MPRLRPATPITVLSPDPITVAELDAIDLFAGLGAAELAEWAQRATVREAAAGEILVEQGEHPPGLLLVLDGGINTVRVDNNGIEPVARHEPPTWMGAVALLTGTELPVRALAVADCRVALVAASDFHDLVHSHLSVHDRIMRRIAPVYARVTQVDANRARLAALGTLAAGLAHGLNNPSAAAQRAAAALTETMRVGDDALTRLLGMELTPAVLREIAGRRTQATARADAGVTLGAVGAADAEDALLGLLEDHGVGEAWTIAEPLAAAGLQPPWVEGMAELAGPATDPVLRWVAAGLAARRLSAEVAEAARSMSELVNAIKSYAFLDRGALVAIDLEQALDSAIALAGHRLGRLRIRREYAEGVPALTGRGSALSLVWTNLIDNAVDAAGDSGTIAVSTRAEGDTAVVEITDDGAGIPPAISDRIFDPFFTTKAVGRGAGLGLSAARAIVADHPGGSLSVTSRPGCTTFRVSLPYGTSADG
ncbi:MAG: histidine kinase [Conexibacter sp.]|nr:histidine kinase [Conexibacter sp.]